MCVRGQVLALKNHEFITAARAYGAGTPHIILRHLLPNVLGPVVIYASLTVPGVMLLEATLSFLGLGIQPPDASWGVLIREGADSMETYPGCCSAPASSSAPPCWPSISSATPCATPWTPNPPTDPP